ncbi:hypothetical protein I603_2276 [Erythrobacter dokdonensis DSW-74]|uniref:Uncharacterized protein n=1 Tax=Erythrobacter dokdonensis DSW-74 TaxID=1300349 RepID=A0A1A7BCU7_9SPHN|nr:hypothetical protein I603_2276 [Erythrobacter dokdonensis DSW-74]
MNEQNAHGPNPPLELAQGGADGGGALCAGSNVKSTRLLKVTGQTGRSDDPPSRA